MDLQFAAVPRDERAERLPVTRALAGTEAADVAAGYLLTGDGLQQLGG